MWIQGNEERPEEMWDRVALDDHEVRTGLDSGSLVTDVRLREAFRRIRAHESAAEDDELGADAVGSAVFSEAELVRLQRWLDDVHRRVALVERRPGLRAR